MLNRQTIVLATSLIIIASFLTGCVYLRFLKVKKQLNNFEENFVINDQKELSIKFLKPVLLPGDIVWLMLTEPLKKENKESVEIWHYMLEKRYRVRKKEPANFDIPVKMVFTGGKLNEIILPEKLTKYFSKKLFQKMLSSFGEANISKMKKKVGSEFKSPDSDEIPKLKDIVFTLGQPYSKGISGEEIVYIYKYYIKSPNPKNPRLKITYKFDKTTKYIKRLEGNVRGIKLRMDFTKID